MPDPASLVRQIDRAAVLLRAAPGRTGRLVRIDADELLIAGDLHGHLEHFRHIYRRADLEHHPRRHLLVQELIHGPYFYPTGGDKSHQLLDVVSALVNRHPKQVHVLPGNHELAQATGQLVLKNFEDLNDLFREGVRFAYADHAADVYAAYLHLIAAMPLAVVTPNRVFASHSLPAAKKLDAFDPAVLLRETVPADLDPGGSVHSLVWGRDTTDENAAAFLAKVDADLLVTGHIPTDEGFEVPNGRQLIVDCHASPAALVLFPATKPLTHAELIKCVEVF